VAADKATAGDGVKDAETDRLPGAGPLNLIRLAALEAIADPAEKKKQIEVVEAAYKQLSSAPEIVNTIPVWMIRLEAGLALARDDINGGIVKLDSALARVPAEAGDNELRIEILQDLSQAYLKVNQTGSARPLLAELVQRRPNTCRPACGWPKC
jgi:hypothetical protein